MGRKIRNMANHHVKQISGCVLNEQSRTECMLTPFVQKKLQIFTFLLQVLVLAAFLLAFVFQQADVVYGAEPDLEDGEYSVTLEMSGGSGKASVTSPTLMTVKDGVATATITWSSSNYDYMIVDGVTYYNQSEEDMNSQFEIPILCWDAAMEVTADTTAMGTPVEIQYSFYFYSDSIADKGQLPQVAAMRVLCTAIVIIVVGGILNYILKRKRRYLS